MGKAGNVGKPGVAWLGMVGCLYLVVSLVNGTTGQPPGAFPSPPTPLGGQVAAGGTSSEPRVSLTPMVVGDGMLGFAGPSGSGGYLVVLVHSGKQSMAVYEVAVDGKVTLSSSRKLSQDFEVQFNEQEPTAAQIERLRQRAP